MFQNLKKIRYVNRAKSNKLVYKGVCQFESSLCLFLVILKTRLKTAYKRIVELILSSNSTPPRLRIIVSEVECTFQADDQLSSILGADAIQKVSKFPSHALVQSGNKIICQDLFSFYLFIYFFECDRARMFDIFLLIYSF